MPRRLTEEQPWQLLRSMASREQMDRWRESEQLKVFVDPVIEPEAFSISEMITFWHRSCWTRRRAGSASPISRRRARGAAAVAQHRGADRLRVRSECRSWSARPRPCASTMARIATAGC
jgi:hypothetical protein